MLVEGLTLHSVTLGDRFYGDRILFNTVATSEPSGERFEFCLHTTSQNGLVEVYDFPASYDETPRFIGYLPRESGDALMALAKERVRKVDCALSLTRGWWDLTPPPGKRSRKRAKKSATA